MNVALAEQSTDMPLPAEEVARVRPRRQRLGMKITELAQEAGISRDTLSDLEAGTKRPHPDTVAKVVGALDRIEQEVGLDAPPALPEGFRYVGDPTQQLVSFTVGEGIGQVVIQGPIENVDLLRQQAERLLERAYEEARKREGT